MITKKTDCDIYEVKQRETREYCNKVFTIYILVLVHVFRKVFNFCVWFDKGRSSFEIFMKKWPKTFNIGWVIKNEVDVMVWLPI